MTPREYDRRNIALVCCRPSASHTGACPNAGKQHRSCTPDWRANRACLPPIASSACFVLDHQWQWLPLPRSAAPPIPIKSP
jgi:hypothetical protein